MEVVVSCICEDFLCQACVTATVLLIVKGWLKWVKKETWNHSGRCLVCKQHAFVLGIPNVNYSGSLNSECPTTTKKYYGLVAMSLFQVASEHVSELSLSFPGVFKKEHQGTIKLEQVIFLNLFFISSQKFYKAQNSRVNLTWIINLLLPKRQQIVQKLTTRDCKGPQTNMPKNIGSIKT